jgi:hypothetical protein
MLHLFLSTLDESGNRDPPIRDYFQKTESDLTRSARNNWVILYVGREDQNILRLSPVLRTSVCAPIEIRADVRKH